ncbi:MAG: hypothetical protein QOF72_3046 [Blastocatellia bacterium]|nr:hypothetical protein [Blastocatellia bacterium]
MSGTWQPLVHQPTFNASTMLLLNDGSVMCQESGGLNWSRLTPDQNGSYVNGTWAALAPMHFTRLYYASAVLPDGRVFVAGGEYSNAGSETNTAEIYNPGTDTWTTISAPPGWTVIGDAPCCVLPDGTVLLGSIGDPRTAIYHPSTNTWTAAGNKNDRSSEETWTLLPDQTVLTAECASHPRAEKYVIPANAWVSAGTVPVELVEPSSIEIGPALLLPDGRVFAVGATSHTALYTMPPIANQTGSWAIGPDFPLGPGGKTLGAKDAPGCLLPNGNVLCLAGPVDGVSGHYLSPSYFYEFNGSSLVKVPDPPNAGSVPFVGRMMLVPTGQVLFAAGSPAVHVYTPSGGPDGGWRPHITSNPATIRPFNTYTLHGRQLNGLSQAVSYGDDASGATNYPIVRLRHLATGHVRYCRTFDHSTMGVATGTIIESTNFAVPWGTDLGPTELCVIANGIVSDNCVTITVAPFIWHWPFDEAMVNVLIGSLADGPLWVLGPHGPVPVDPWGPKVAKEAAAARDKIVEGIKSLQALGQGVLQQRFKQNATVIPAQDPELTGGKDEDKK